MMVGERETDRQTDRRVFVVWCVDTAGLQGVLHADTRAASESVDGT